MYPPSPNSFLVGFSWEDQYSRCALKRRTLCSITSSSCEDYKLSEKVEVELLWDNGFLFDTEYRQLAECLVMAIFV